MPLHKLTPRKVITAPPGKHEDGGGLRLVASNRGSKKWVLRFTLDGKRHEMGLGSFPDVSLRHARDHAIRCRQQVMSGINPIIVRQISPTATPTFATCAARYIKTQRRSWKNRKHAKQWLSTLKTYAIPLIGKKYVDSITTDDILAILKPIWAGKTETAKRVQGRMENILDYAAAHKYRDSLNPARWRGHLDKLLPRPTRIKQIKHHPAMPHYEVADFMVELSQKNSISALALQFLILTATRTSEALQARWQEIDMKSATWAIPASRMKARREHRIPLSDAAMTIIMKLPRIEGNHHLFPGTRARQALSNMALLQLMRGMDYGVGGNRGDYVPHGFRSSFRDWSGEVSSFPRDVAEMALAHVIENKVEAAYRRGDLFAKRRKMMREWADYLSQK
ncbi:MAG: tyrosine-type recombinase/integrase [Gammaproteobacteria bacterium]|nr:tyrosine-type recombinase/integrase [Gammaproteobacteria bacterium]